MKESKYDVSTLPKWAQERIGHLETERELAVRALKNYLDEQTPSKVFVEEAVSCKPGGPLFTKRYIQTDEVTFDLGAAEGGHSPREITIRFDYREPALRISAAWNGISITPDCSNVIKLGVTK